MRRKVSAICWLAAAIVLITSRPDVGTLFEWRELAFLVWLAARIGFLAYTGILLWEADEEIESLKRTQNRLEEIISELQSSASQS